jgi:hypothetical protein
MSSDQFRAFARECLRWAEETSVEEDRQHFFAMAKAWMHAAAELSRSTTSLQTQPSSVPRRRPASG